MSMNRNLDGYYFRVKRNDKYDNICWSDLSEEERLEFIKNYDKDALIRFCVGLGSTIREIGDQLDLYGGNV